MNINPLTESERHESMRGYFAFYLHEQMRLNPDIFVLTGDLGFGMFDKIKRDFPERFINCGASEQAMIGITVGLALNGKIPIVYSITPFLLYRPFEMIRYINHESIPVLLIGGGRDQDYLDDGFSHFSEEDKQVMDLFPNIFSTWPESKEEIKGIIETAINSKLPTYINLTR
jgi:transketolase